MDAAFDIDSSFCLGGAREADQKGISTLPEKPKPSHRGCPDIEAESHLSCQSPNRMMFIDIMSNTIAEGDDDDDDDDGSVIYSLEPSPMPMQSNSDPQTSRVFVAKEMASHTGNNDSDGRAIEFDCESQRKTESTERMASVPKSPSFYKSLVRSWWDLLWLMYHSTTLVLIPFVLISVIFSSLWTFRVDYNSYLYQYLCSQSFFVLSSYMSISVTFLYIFAIQNIGVLLYKITIPLSILNITIFVFNQLFPISYLSFAYYVIFTSHYFLILRKIVSIHSIPAIEERNREGTGNRGYILATDGTPAALFKGFIAYVFGYYLSVYHLLVLFMDSGVFMRIIGRVIVIPFLYNAIDTYQSNLLIFKSTEHMKYRMIPGNIMNTISTCILRLMITDSPHLSDTIAISLSSSISEICFRVSFMPRTLYFMQLWKLLKKLHPCRPNRRKKVFPLDNVGPPPLQSGTQSIHGSCIPQPPGDVRQNEVAVNHVESNVKEDGDEMLGVSELVQRVRNKEKSIEPIIKYHMDRSYNHSMLEIQSAVVIPITLFLYRPAKDYVRFETFSNIEEMGYSILIQLFAELFTQFTCITLENYIYSMEVPIVRSCRYNLKWPIIIQSILLLLMSASMALSPFLTSPSGWPKD